MWAWTQVFGDPDTYDQEIDFDTLISSVQFDPSGEMIAVGDHGGQIVIYRRVDCDNDTSSDDNNDQPDNLLDFDYYFSFQGHAPQIDVFTANEVPETVSALAFMSPTTLLSANAKTIRMWRICEKKMAAMCNFNQESGDPPKDSSDLCVPEIVGDIEVMPEASCKREFSDAHLFNIHSVSSCADQELILSADQFAVNLWNPHRRAPAFKIVDLHPTPLQGEVTSAVFHPDLGNLLLYSTSIGQAHVFDLRQYSSSQIFNNTRDDGSQFRDYLARFSDAQWIEDNFIVTRDFFTMKIWDRRMSGGESPYDIIPIHDYLMPQITDLYEIDALLDPFQCSIGGVDKNICIGGSYDTDFIVYDRASSSRDLIKGENPDNKDSSRDPFELDYTKKVLCTDVHPSHDLLAFGCVNTLYVYQHVDMDDLDIQ